MMRMILILTVAVAAFAAPFSGDLDKTWNDYKKTFQKYYNSNEEYGRRLIWETNVGTIVKHNLDADLGKHSFYLGLNHLADMTAEEVRANLNGYRGIKTRSGESSVFIPPPNLQLPDEVDWRKEGLVTAVKNQKQCGSCWAFSTTGSLEGQHMKKTGELVSLSEQNLVDCSTAEGNHGCNGGWMDYAFIYIKKNKGIDTEASYPYEAVDDTCRFKKSTVGATVTGYVDIPTGDEDALQKAVASVGPVSVAIDATHTSFHLYKGGIYDEESCSPTELDHAVLAIGYGTEDGQDYWLVKNSWGTQWGEKGYIKMSRNKSNQCGIATKASYPLVQFQSSGMKLNTTKNTEKLYNYFALI